MGSLKELNDKVFKELETYDVELLKPYLKNVAQGSYNDVMDTKNSLYYQWLACLIKVLEPKQVVELGGAMGTSALCMLSQLANNSKLYSITLAEHGLEFSYIKEHYPQLTKIIGDDSDMGVWPKDLDWSKTDLLFIDAEHTEEAVRREMKEYLPLIGEGKVVIMDDIKMDGLFEAWVDIKTEKLDLSVLHHSGFGMFKS